MTPLHSTAPETTLPTGIGASLTDNMLEQDKSRIHDLVLRYAFCFLGIILGIVLLLGAVAMFLPQMAVPGLSKDRLEGLLDVGTFLQGILTLSITLAGVLVTLHIARTALNVAQTSLVISQNSAKLAEREFNLEAQRHANEIFVDMRAVQRRMNEALQLYKSTSRRLLSVPEHWTALLLWRLEMLERGDVWGAPAQLADEIYQETLLQHVRSLRRVPERFDEDREPLWHTIARFEERLAQRNSDTSLDLLQAVNYLEEQDIWQRQRSHIAQALRAWLQVLEAAESRPWVFHLYRYEEKTMRAWDGMQKRCEHLLRIFDSQSDDDQSQGLEIVMRAMVLFRSGYLNSLNDTDIWTRTDQLPMLCLLAQTSGLANAYQHGPDARQITQWVYNTLKPLTYSQGKIREIAQLMVPGTSVLPNADDEFAPTADDVGEILHGLREMWHDMANVHGKAPHIFSSAAESETSFAVVEHSLANWKRLTQASLNRRNPHELAPEEPQPD